MDLSKDLHDIIRQVCKLDEGVPLTPTTSLVDDLGVDSLALVELIVALEETFNIQISDEELRIETFETVGKTEAYIQSKQDG